MYEYLFDALPESARACRRLYDAGTGGYHLPPREHNVALRLAEIDAYRARYPDVLHDCIEAPVADLLYALVVNTRSRWILETGTSRGFSTAHLAAGARFVGGDAARVLTIDLAPAPNPFFEGSAVAGSITARFLPHLKAGGLFALHDTLVYDDLGLVVSWLAGERGRRDGLAADAPQPRRELALARPHPFSEGGEDRSR